MIDEAVTMNLCQPVTGKAQGGGRGGGLQERSPRHCRGRPASEPSQVRVSQDIGCDPRGQD